jgi:hypothetical protein
MDSGRETDPLPAIAFSAMHPSEWETLGDRLNALIRPLIRKVCERQRRRNHLGRTHSASLCACIFMGPAAHSAEIGSVHFRPASWKM